MFLSQKEVSLWIEGILISWALVIISLCICIIMYILNICNYY